METETHTLTDFSVMKVLKIDDVCRKTNKWPKIPSMTFFRVRCQPKQLLIIKIFHLENFKGKREAKRSTGAETSKTLICLSRCRNSCRFFFFFWFVK
jgi:hypothetical protein